MAILEETIKMDLEKALKVFERLNNFVEKVNLTQKVDKSSTYNITEVENTFYESKVEKVTPVKIKVAELDSVVPFMNLNDYGKKVNWEKIEKVAELKQKKLKEKTKSATNKSFFLTLSTYSKSLNWENIEKTEELDYPESTQTYISEEPKINVKFLTLKDFKKDLNWENKKLAVITTKKVTEEVIEEIDTVTAVFSDFNWD